MIVIAFPGVAFVLAGCLQAPFVAPLLASDTLQAPGACRLVPGGPPPGIYEGDSFCTVCWLSLIHISEPTRLALI
eukprot:5590546-Alexandrium_andersonii.AAC.1